MEYIVNGGRRSGRTTRMVQEAISYIGPGKPKPIIILHTAAMRSVVQDMIAQAGVPPDAIELRVIRTSPPHMLDRSTNPPRLYGVPFDRPILWDHAALDFLHFGTIVD